MKKFFTLLVLAILGVMTPALAVTWEVTYPVGGKAASVDDVQIKCTEVAYRYLAEDATATLINAEGVVVKTLVRDDITLSFKGSYCTVDFEFNPAITEVGTYTIAVPEGAFSTSEGANSAAFEVEFTVEAASYTKVDWGFKCTNLEGGKAEALEYVVLMGKYPVQTVNADATAQLYDASFNVVANLDATNNLFAYNDCLMVAMNEPITTPGTYALIINEGAVVCADANVTNDMAMIELTVEAAAPVPVTWEVTYPVGGKAASVDDVQIKCTEVAYRYLAEDATATLINAEGVVVKTLVRDDITLSFKGSYCTVDFEFNPAITEVGTYTIAVPEGAFSTSEGANSAAFEVEFTVEAASYTKVDWGFKCTNLEGGKAEALEYVVLMGKYPVQTVNADATAQLYDASFNVVANLDATNNLFAYNDCLMVAMNEPITTPGSYALIINEGAVVCADANVTNDMAMIELTVEAAAPEYTIIAMPEDNSTVSTADGGIQSIYLAVNGYAYNAANETGIEMTIAKDGELFATVGASALKAAMDNSTLLITLPKDAQMTQVGNYTVTMPEGYFKMKSVETSEIVNSPEIILNYTISAPAAEPLSWTVEPAVGTVNEIDKVTITFNKPVKQALTTDVHLFFTNSSYLTETVTEGALTVSEDGLVATIDFDPVFAHGGIFQVRLYEGNEQLAVVDGETFPGINLTYKVEAPLYAVSDPQAGSEVESLQQTKIKFPYTNKLAASANFAAWYVSGDKKIAAELVKVGSYDFGDPAYVTVKSAEAITENGEWTLLIEAGSLVLSNYNETMESPEVSVNYTIGTSTSIIDIMSDEHGSEIYNLQGIRIKSAKGLTPGLYIVGGKKVYIR